MVKNGILITEKIGNARFMADLIPTSNKKARPGETMKPEYITVHNTGNSAKGADAKAHTKYVDNIDNYISWHFTVDEYLIFQELPVNEHGWHAGDGRGDGNMKSIGIEICENADGDWVQARKNGIALIVQLMLDLNIPLTKVVPHKHWSGKQCPHKILAEGWDKFMADVKTEYVRTVSNGITANPEVVSDWAKESWLKAEKKICKDGRMFNDGKGAKNPVTEEQLMVFFDKLGLLD